MMKQALVLVTKNVDRSFQQARKMNDENSNFEHDTTVSSVSSSKIINGGYDE
jgi:hypothetical protein